MKAHLAKVSLALLSAVFLFGCQDMGSELAGPEGPQFGAKSCADNPNPGKCKGSNSGSTVSLFVESGGIKDVLGDATCAGGAKVGATVGQVTWQNIRRTDNHTHANVVLSGAEPDIYDIFANQHVLCPANVDFDARGGHKRVVTVDGNGDGDVRIGLTFGTDADPPILEGHAPGPHQLWLTFVRRTTGEVLRSVAFEMVIKDHSGHD